MRETDVLWKHEIINVSSSDSDYGQGSYQMLSSSLSFIAYFNRQREYINY